ncbi:hypothetical protein PINS_up000678 [Pythium insidiosum]|nr:hypothetical protein PINS_up000678 [Pythium insidiosum]
MSWSAWSSRINVGSIVSQGLEQVSKLKEDVEKQFDQVVSGAPSGGSGSGSGAAAATAEALDAGPRLDLTKLEVPPPLPIPPAPLSERRSEGAVSRFNALNLPAPPRSADGKLPGRQGGAGATAAATTNDAFFASFLSNAEATRGETEKKRPSSSSSSTEAASPSEVVTAQVDDDAHVNEEKDARSEEEETKKDEVPAAEEQTEEPIEAVEPAKEPLVLTEIEATPSADLEVESRDNDDDEHAPIEAPSTESSDERAEETNAKNDNGDDVEDAASESNDPSSACAVTAVEETTADEAPDDATLVSPSDENGHSDHNVVDEGAPPSDTGAKEQLHALQTALAQREAQLLSTSEMIQELHDELDKTCEREVAAVERNRVLSEQVELLRQEVVRLNRVAVAAQQASARDAEVAALQQAVVEKDEKLKALLDEGQALSVKQAQLEQRLRQLRREKNEEEEQKLKLQTQCDALSTQVTELSTALKTAQDDAKRSAQDARQLQQTVEQTSRQVATLEKELTVAKREADAWREQHDDVARRHDELEREIEQHRDTSASHASLSAERSEMEATIAFLTQHVRDLEADAARRDELARLEAADLKKKWQDALHRVEALGHSVTDATQPLLRQIHALQEDQRGRQQAWNASEAALRQRAQELTAQRVALEHDKTELTTQVQALQEQLSELQLTVHRRETDVTRERERVEQSQQRERDARSRLEALQVELEELRLKYTDVRHAKDALTTRVQELQRDAIEHDACGKQSVMSSEELEQLRRRSEQLEHDLNWHKQELQRMRRSSSTTSERDELAVNGNAETESHGGAEPTTQASILERSLMTSPVDGAPLSATSVLGVSQLQQRIRLREGENRLLRQQLQALESKQQASTEELVRLSTRNALLESNAATWQRTNEELEQLKQRQHVLLELFGEKEEQVEELQTEVAELKAFYRKQLDTLAQQQQQQQRQ